MLTNNERNKTVSAQDIEHYLKGLYSKLLAKMEDTLSSYEFKTDGSILELKGAIKAIEDMYQEFFIDDEEETK